MTFLSTGPFGHSRYTDSNGFVPFVVYGTPNILNGNYGKRWSQIYAIEKVANFLEQTLVDFEADGSLGTNSDDYQIEFSKPVKYSRQFGDKPGLLTVNGNLKKTKLNIPNKPTDNVIVISANEETAGYGGSTNNGTRHPHVACDQMAVYLHDTMNAIYNDWTVYRIDVAGIVYGKGGRTIG